MTPSRSWLYTVLSGGCLLATGYILGAQKAPKEPFLPDNLREAAVVACAVGGNADKTSDTIVAVTYPEGPQYRVLVSRRTNPIESMEDCRVWFSAVEKKWREPVKGVTQ
jgi:hypothetical protein